MLINAHFGTPDKTPIHSSGFADAAFGQTMGATSGETFGQRLSREYSRSTIQGYQHSAIGRSLNRASRSARYQTLKKRENHYEKLGQNRQPTESHASGSVRQEFNSVNVPHRSRFVEPTSRGYDPYK